MRSIPRLTALAFCMVALLTTRTAAQTLDPPGRGDVLRPSTRVDPRLVVTPRPTAGEMDARTLASAVAARPRWVLPAIGAGIGLVAGVVQAHATTRGDYVGLPMEPMYLYPPAYAAAGALLGWLADAVLRE